MSGIPYTQMKRITSFALLALTAALCHAEPATLSMPANNAALGSLKKDIYADFATTYHGPTVGRFGRYSQNAVGEVDPGALAGFEAWFNTAWVLDHEREIAIGPDLWFVYQPGREGRDQFQLQDVGLKAFHKSVVVTDHLRVYASASVQAPTSDYAREHGMTFALRSTPWVMYDVGQTRWRLGSWSDLRWLAGVRSDMDFKLYLQPYVAYRLNDRWMLNLAYETEAHHDVGDRALEFRNILSNFQPGAVWQVAKNVKLTGYLLLFTRQHLSTDNTGLGATLYTQLL